MLAAGEVIITTVPTTMQQLLQWTKPAADMGPWVYQLTQGPRSHKHAYHVYYPWSADDSLLLTARYDRQSPTCDICVIDMNDGSVRQVGQSSKWDAHTVALQQWQGDSGRIIFRSVDDSENDNTDDNIAGNSNDNDSGPRATVVSINADGSDPRSFHLNTDTITTSADGKWLFYVSSRDDLFPDDALASRDDKGLFRMNMDTGQRELILTVAQMLKLLPDAQALSHCHLYPKMLVSHRTSDRLLFNLTNTFWDRGNDEPAVRALITVNGDGSDPAYLGVCTHHPNWHPTQNHVVVNLKDCNNKLRLGLYQGDGQELVTYVPQAAGSGHPSFSPDGRWICTDMGVPNGDSGIAVYETATGRRFVPTTYHAISEGYSAFKAIDQRASGVSVTQALKQMRATAPKAWQTHCHGAWSRDGSAYLFNADRDQGHGSQLYAIDMQRFLASIS